MTLRTMARVGPLARLGAVAALSLSITACGVTVPDIDTRSKFRHLPAGSDELADIEVEIYKKARDVCGTAMNIKSIDTQSKGAARDATSVSCHYPVWLAPYLRADPD